MCVCTHILICKCTRTNTPARTHAHTHTHTHTHLYISTYTTTRTKQNAHTHANTHNHSGVGNTKTVTIAVRIIATFRNFLTSSTSLLVNLTDANPYGSSRWTFFSGKRPLTLQIYAQSVEFCCQTRFPIWNRHRAASWFWQVPKSYTYLHLTLLYILTLKIRSKLARKNKMPSSTFASHNHAWALAARFSQTEHVWITTNYRFVSTNPISIKWCVKCIPLRICVFKRHPILS